jgi:hypothetical protein
MEAAGQRRDRRTTIPQLLDTPLGRAGTRNKAMGEPWHCLQTNPPIQRKLQPWDLAWSGSGNIITDLPIWAGNGQDQAEQGSDL